jgi:hypothetical protein
MSEGRRSSPKQYRAVQSQQPATAPPHFQRAHLPSVVGCSLAAAQESVPPLPLLPLPSHVLENQAWGHLHSEAKGRDPSSQAMKYNSGWRQPYRATRSHADSRLPPATEPVSEASKRACTAASHNKLQATKKVSTGICDNTIVLSSQQQWFELTVAGHKEGQAVDGLAQLSICRRFRLGRRCLGVAACSRSRRQQEQKSGATLGRGRAGLS